MHKTFKGVRKHCLDFRHYMGTISEKVETKEEIQSLGSA